jgi:hypothetical protein
MPNINFPTSPALNDQYSFEGKTWTWNGVAWVILSSPTSLRLDSSYGHANAAFDKANTALSNNQILAGLQAVSSTANITFDYVATANNGQGLNFKVGDDAWIGDVNLADTIRITGQQNVNNAYISFGASNANTLGRAGTGPLTYTGDFKATGLVSGNELTSTNSTGSEGGQVNLAIPASGTSLVSSVTIDVYGNQLRFFQGDSAKGAYIDLTATSAGVGTNLLNPTSTPDTVARATADAAFAKANIADQRAVTSGAYANSSYLHANAAFMYANTIAGGSAIDNTARSLANTADQKAVSAGSYANAAFAKANSVQSFLTFDANGTSVVADSQTDTVTITPANGIIVTGNAAGDSITFGLSELAQGNTGSQIFVSPNGNDSNDGLASSRAKRTIRAGMNAARPFTQVTIASGTYEEITPIIVPQFVQVKGDGERTTIIKPVDTSKDVFWVNNGCWISCMKFENYLANAVAFPGSTVSSGTAQSGGASTITLASGEDVLDGIYRDMTISITSGTGAGQGKIISSYNGTTKVVTANSAWATQPDNTSVYAIKIPVR